MIEKRATQRHRVFKGGTVTFEGNGVACTVRNISDSGAAIDLENPGLLPHAFTLSISCDNLVRNCRAVWRNDRRVGLAFVQ